MVAGDFTFALLPRWLLTVSQSDMNTRAGELVPDPDFVLKISGPGNFGLRGKINIQCQPQRPGVPKKDLHLQTLHPIPEA